MTIEQAAQVCEGGLPTIYRWITEGLIHPAGQSGEVPLLCADSLAEQLTKTGL